MIVKAEAPPQVEWVQKEVQEADQAEEAVVSSRVSLI